jgi:hypothetical protein
VALLLSAVAAVPPPCSPPSTEMTLHAKVLPLATALAMSVAIAAGPAAGESDRIDAHHDHHRHHHQPQPAQQHAPSCEAGVQWHPSIQLHDMTGAGDMNSTANLSATECAALCCAVPRCMAFFHTTNASMWNNNCGPHPCCFIKPTFNATRLNDTCLGRPGHPACTGQITSGVLPRALPTKAPVRVYRPHNLSATHLPTNRTRLGLPGDYKPWVAVLGNGDVLIVAFASAPKSQQAQAQQPLQPATAAGTEEHAVFWRSTDGGLSYSPREYRSDLNGREWSINVLNDGTLLMPNALLPTDKNFVRPREYKYCNTAILQRERE